MMVTRGMSAWPPLSSPPLGSPVGLAMQCGVSSPQRSGLSTEWSATVLGSDAIPDHLLAMSYGPGAPQDARATPSTFHVASSGSLSNSGNAPRRRRENPEDSRKRFNSRG